MRDCTFVRRQTTRPGVTHVAIYAPTEALVQKEINRDMRAVERDGGLATFDGPVPLPTGGYAAEGTIHEA